VNFFQMLFLLVLLTVLGIAIAHQRIEVARTGYAVQRFQQAKSELQEQNRRLLYQIDLLSAPDKLRRMVQQGKIKLGEPATLLLLELRSREGQGMNSLAPLRSPAPNENPGGRRLRSPG
jgi:hypothetical protein